MKRTGVMDQLFAVPSTLCRKEGDHYLESEILLDGENEIGQCTDDPEGSHAESIPMIEDPGKC